MTGTKDPITTNPAGSPTIKHVKGSTHARDERIKINADPMDALRALTKPKRRG
jgi:hypothetical protein